MAKLKKLETKVTPELADAVRVMSREKQQTISEIIESALRAYRPLKKYAHDLPNDRPETRGRPRKDPTA